MAVFLALPGCKLLFPGDAHLLKEPDFRTPEGAFHTLQAAIGHDDAELAYYCFSEGFKEKWGIGLDTFFVTWERVRHEFPSVKWIRHMSTSGTGIHPGQERGFVNASFLGKELLVRTVRLDFVRITTRTGEVKEFYIDSVAKLIQGKGSYWNILLEDPDLRAIDPNQVISVELIYDWKIDSLAVPTEPAD